MTDLGTQNLLGTADGEDAQTLRDRLALSTAYLANWYTATEGSVAKSLGDVSPDTALWWQQIDAVRAQVESVYAELQQPANLSFPGNKEVGDYDAASAAWSDLYLKLALSIDTVDVSLLDQAASFGQTIAQAPGLLVPQIGNELGKAIGGALGQFLAQTWPYLAGAGLLYGIYLFRRPLAAIAGKAAGA